MKRPTHDRRSQLQSSIDDIAKLADELAAADTNGARHKVMAKVEAAGVWKFQGGAYQFRLHGLVGSSTAGGPMVLRSWIAKAQRELAAAHGGGNAS